MLAILLFMLFCYSVTTTGTLAIYAILLFCDYYHWDACYFAIYAILLFCDYHWVTCYFAIYAILLFCDYHWVTCYFAIYAILLFHGLPGTGTLAILLLILCMRFCFFLWKMVELHNQRISRKLKAGTKHTRIDDRTLSEHP